jgi:hypothetical protein
MRALILSTLAFTGLSFAAFACGGSGNGGGSSGSMNRGAGSGAIGQGQPTFPFQPSNISLAGHDLSALVDVDVATDCEIVSDQNLGGGLCDAAALDWIATESDGVTKVHVYVVKSFQLEQNAKLKVSGPFVAAIVSFGDLSVLGPLTAAAVSGTAGPGGYGQSSGFTAGAGPGGGPAGVKDALGPPPGTGAISGISGGGGSYCGAGATGTQEGNSAGPDTVSPGAAAAPYGSADLRPLLAGSSGGTGGLGSAGSGGGAIQLVSGGAFTLGSLGYINVGGGGGGSAGETNAGQQASGGGSGGAILIEAKTATLKGVLAANGGGGGGYSTDGQDATPDGNAAAGGTNNGAALGGTGGAGTTVAGAAGTVATTSAAGAGGGGAGRIRINTTTGAAVTSGTISPAVATPCATQGTVRAIGSGV